MIYYYLFCFIYCKLNIRLELLCKTFNASTFLLCKQDPSVWFYQCDVIAGRRCSRTSSAASVATPWTCPPSTSCVNPTPSTNSEHTGVFTFYSRGHVYDSCYVVTIKSPLKSCSFFPKFPFRILVLQLSYCCIIFPNMKGLVSCLFQWKKLVIICLNL